MKWLKVIILFIVMTSYLPLEEFCEDHHSGDGQEHHCILACHNCHQVISPDSLTKVSSPEQSMNIAFNYAFHYQAPVLDQTHRPPKVSL
ncbi:MAG: hypothetical protein KC618_00215 [Candidatus Omnitrophica bacterium]|nr:hypothetical protein [Candidatus Omnitrophota bacterium]